MKFNIVDKDVRGLLSVECIRVSRLQRSYQWVMQQASDFWNETIAGSKGNYFIGSIMLYSLDKGVFRVAHGQHRIAIVVLALCALRNAFREIGCDEQADELRRLIQRPGINDKPEWVLQSETSRPFLHDDLLRNETARPSHLPSGPEDAGLAGAYEYINGCIQEQRIAVFNDATLSSEEKRSALRERLLSIEDRILSLNVQVTLIEPTEYVPTYADGRYYFYCRMCGGSGSYKEYKPCLGCEGRGIVRKFWWVRLWNWTTKREIEPLSRWI